MCPGHRRSFPGLPDPGPSSTILPPAPSFPVGLQGPCAFCAFIYKSQDSPEDLGAGEGRRVIAAQLCRTTRVKSRLGCGQKTEEQGEGAPEVTSGPQRTVPRLGFSQGPGPGLASKVKGGGAGGLQSRGVAYARRRGLAPGRGLRSGAWPSRPISRKAGRAFPRQEDLSQGCGQHQRPTWWSSPQTGICVCVWGGEPWHAGQGLSIMGGSVPCTLNNGCGPVLWARPCAQVGGPFVEPWCGRGLSRWAWPRGRAVPSYGWDLMPWPGRWEGPCVLSGGWGLGCGRGLQPDSAFLWAGPTQWVGPRLWAGPCGLPSGWVEPLRGLGLTLWAGPRATGRT